jgi:hypothetical protein
MPEITAPPVKNAIPPGYPFKVKSAELDRTLEASDVTPSGRRVALKNETIGGPMNPESSTPSTTSPRKRGFDVTLSAPFQAESKEALIEYFQDLYLRVGPFGDETIVQEDTFQIDVVEIHGDDEVEADA